MPDPMARTCSRLVYAAIIAGVVVTFALGWAARARGQTTFYSRFAQ